MLIVFVLLWILAIIIIFTDPKNESTRWASAIAFLAGFGGLNVVWKENVIPYLSQYTIDYPRLNYLILFLGGLFASVAHYLAPYVLLIYSIIICEGFIKKLGLNKKLLKWILLLPPVLMYILYPINPSFKTSFFLLSIWVVPYILVSNTLIIYSYFREKNQELKRQLLLNCILLVIPTLVSMVTNFILPALKIEGTYIFNTWVIIIIFTTFIVASIKYGTMGVKLKFEKYRYAALENIIDHMSDGFIVIDGKDAITRINQTFNNYFGHFKPGQNFLKILETNSKLNSIRNELTESITKAKTDSKTVLFDANIREENVERFFAFEVTPIVLTGKHLEIVILFKEITEHKRVISLIEQNQNQRIENERLHSLSRLIGGIAHNLKTPLLASSGGIEIISDHTKKIKEAVEKGEVIKDKNIIEEMEMWEERIEEYLSYMSDVITAVKGQAMPAQENEDNYFYIKDAIKKVGILMKHELRKATCEIKYEFKVHEEIKIKGNINYLIQVLNNLISNAIDSYKNQKGSIIEVLILYNSTGKIDIVVKDYGKGIRDEVKNKLFKQMVTTKGKEGTGLGLYISKSIINSKFNGTIRVESAEGKGSSFIITIPTGGEDNE
ncbi:UNVERIFIED_CONTAM: signal transduction histidine kinase [Acetivibrio alkalicellulosi]